MVEGGHTKDETMGPGAEVKRRGAAHANDVGRFGLVEVRLRFVVPAGGGLRC